MFLFKKLDLQKNYFLAMKMFFVVKGITRHFELS